MSPRTKTARFLVLLGTVITLLLGLVLAPAASADTPGVAPAITVQPNSGSVSIAFSDPFDPAIATYEVTTDGGKTWTALNDNFDGFSHTSTVDGLTDGTTYHVGVRGVGANGEDGPTSNIVDVIPGSPQAPGVFTQASDRSAAVEIPAPVDNGSTVTAYYVSLTSDGTTDYKRFDVKGDPTEVLYNDLTNGTTYNVSVRAENAFGLGAEGTTTVVPDTSPAAPTNVVATPDNMSATLTFDPADTNGGTAITHYTVTAKPGGATQDCNDGSPGDCIFPNLTNGTPYTFTIVAYNNSFLGSPDSVPTKPVVPFGLPLAATNLTVAASTATSLTVSFNPAYYAGSTIRGYQISIDGGAHWRDVATRPSGRRLLATATGLVPGTSYRLAVRALNGVGFGPSSAVITGQTAPTAVGRPSARAGVAIALVTWRPAREAATTGYTVYARPGRATCTTYDRYDTSCLIGATAGVRTTFVVVAHDRGGSSVASPASATVLATSPSVPKARPAVPSGLRTVGGNVTKVKGGQHIRLSGLGFMPNSSVVFVVYGSKAQVLSRTVANSAGATSPVVRTPKGKAQRLTFVAFGVTELGSPKAIGKSITRTR